MMFRIGGMAVVVMLLSACGGGTAKCSSQNCAGCCDSTGVCQGGTIDSQCGNVGATCAPCGVGNRCVSKQCVLGTGGGTGGGGTAGGTAGGFAGGTAGGTSGGTAGGASGGTGGGTSGGTGGGTSGGTGGGSSGGTGGGSSGGTGGGSSGGTGGGSSGGTAGGSAGGAAGGFAGGSSGGAAGGSAGGFGGGTGGAITLDVMPPSAVVDQNGQLLIAARVNGTSNQGLTFNLETGVGSLFPQGSAAIYYAVSGSATASVRVTSVANSAATVVVPITITGFAERFAIMPHGVSASALVLAPSTRQSFAAVNQLLSNAGLANTAWWMMPAGSATSDGTVTTGSALGTTWVFAQRPSNVWEWAELSVESTTLPSVQVMPSTVTTTPNGVVQFTAIVTNGGAISWSVFSGGGSISGSGTYTAPAGPSVDVITATELGSGRYGAATVIVQ